MVRVPRIRQGAAACPSCGARRILPEMLFCDQCGKRIPDSLIDKLQAKEPADLQRHAAISETLLSVGVGDITAKSAPTTSSNANVSKAGTKTILQEQEILSPKMKAPDTVFGRRQQILGASLVAFGVLTAMASALSGVWNLSGLGLASFLIGLLLVYLNSRSSYPPELVEASVLSSLANLERVLRELDSETKAIYLKISDRLDVPMVFMPLEQNPALGVELRPTDEGRFLTIDSNDPHRTGLLFEAPGASLLSLMEKESGVNFVDLTLEDFVDPLRSGMVESLEVTADVKATVTPEGVKFRIEDGALRGLSQSVARSAPNVASRLGCPICSAAICATVKAAKTDVILEDATHQSGSHTVALRFVRGVTNESN